MKIYFSVVSLVYKSNRKRFLLIVSLSVLVGLIEGLLTKLNIEVLTAIQNIMAGSTDYWKLILFFCLYYLLAPNYYVHLPMEGYLKSLLNQDLKMAMFEDIFNKTYSVNMLNFENPDVYDHISKATENITNQRFMTIIESIIRIPVFVTAIISIITVLSLYNPLLILLSLVSMLPVFLSRYLQGKRFFILKESQQSELRFTEYLWSMFTERNTNRDMRTFGTFSYLSNKYSNHLCKLTEEAWKYEKRSFRINMILNSIRPIGLGLGLIFSAYMVYNGSITLALFASISQALSTVQECANGFIDILAETLNNLPFVKHFFRFTDMEEEEPGDQILDRPIHSIEFKDVYFKYPANDYYTLKGVSFHIQENESVSLLGYNGAGKSTIVKLLCGFYTPDQGGILINGIPAVSINKESLWRSMSVVFQDYVRYNLTLRENIGFGDIEHVNEQERIIQFLNETEGYEFIDSLQDGMETILGRELGDTDLSGGQWQKVAIARGRFGNCSLIVLDEPTASLDPIAEADVYNRFKEITNSKISLIISHRIGSASIADRIIVLKDGVVLENGSHEELIKLNGEYNNLFHLQARWYV